jgi:hypothetical protein
MVDIKVTDCAQPINCTDDVSGRELASPEAKARLEASLLGLTELIQMALSRDLTTYPTEIVKAFLDGIVGSQLDKVKALSQELWLATCRDLFRKCPVKGVKEPSA